MTQPSESDPQGPLEPPRQEQPQPRPESQPVGYEFTKAQNESIRVLSGRMKFVGIFHVIASVFIGFAGLVALFIAPLIGVLYLIMLAPQLLIGIWTINAANSFELVVNTRGHDIPHLINALSSLRRLYTLMFWLLIVALIFMVVAIAAGIFLWTMGMLPVPPDGSTYTELDFKLAEAIDRL